ncbi:hypothetical protein J6590_068756 [Homalodisca vitripennis]|nr:hypothetical protein J6590_068756 [Homalodisca vitripennis]
MIEVLMFCTASGSFPNGGPSGDSVGLNLISVPWLLVKMQEPVLILKLLLHIIMPAIQIFPFQFKCIPCLVWTSLLALLASNCHIMILVTNTFS